MNVTPSPRLAQRPRFTTRTVVAVLSTALALGGFGGLSTVANAADTDAAPKAVVTVLKDLHADPTGRTVRVTGTGFDPAGVQGTVLLKDRPAGTFVLFGRMPDVWEPSKGVPSSVRMAGRDASSQKWAVLAEDLAAVTDDSHTGATVLEPDGTFTTTIKVNRNFPSAPSTGNFGIYTYAGDIQNVYAPYETYTPISFVGDTDVVDLPAAEAPVEPAPEPTPPTTPETKRQAKLAAKVTTKATTRKSGRIRLTVTAGKTRVSGKVTVTVKAPGRKAVTKKVRLAKGKAAVTLPKAKKKGTYEIRARYTGSTKFAATKRTVVKYRVRK